MHLKLILHINYILINNKFRDPAIKKEKFEPHISKKIKSKKKEERILGSHCALTGQMCSRSVVRSLPRPASRVVAVQRPAMAEWEKDAQRGDEGAGSTQRAVGALPHPSLQPWALPLLSVQILTQSPPPPPTPTNVLARPALLLLAWLVNRHGTRNGPSEVGVKK